MRKWVKVYTEVLHDPKMLRLTPRQWQCCVSLFLLAGWLDENGHLGTIEDVALHLRMSQRIIAEALPVLAEIKIVHEKKGVWSLTNFEKRQAKPPSDQREAVRERVKRHRNRKGTQGNEPVTPLQPGVTLPEADSDSESEADIDIEAEAGASAPPRPANEIYSLAQALGEVCRMDFEKNKGRLLREAKLLHESAEILRQYYGSGSWWYQHDWRGKKGEKPTPATIRETWGSWSPNGSTPGASEPKSYPAIRRLAAKKGLTDGQ